MQQDNPLNTQGIERGLTEIVAAIRDQKPSTFSYTTDEVDTGTTWIDAKTIYKKTISGTLAATAGARSVVALTPAGFTALIHSEGYIQEADGVRFMINSSRSPAASFTINAYANIMDAGAAPSLFYGASATGTASYAITLYYTK